MGKQLVAGPLYRPRQRPPTSPPLLATHAGWCRGRVRPVAAVRPAGREHEGLDPLGGDARGRLAEACAVTPLLQAVAAPPTRTRPASSAPRDRHGLDAVLRGLTFPPRRNVCSAERQAVAWSRAASMVSLLIIMARGRRMDGRRIACKPAANARQTRLCYMIPSSHTARPILPVCHLHCSG